MRLIKDNSLASIVGVGELSFVAAQVNTRMVYPAKIFMLVGVMCRLLRLGLDWLTTMPFR